MVKKKATGDLDGDGKPETVAVVHCAAGIGTPPDGVYVLTRDRGAGKPRVVATLVDPKDRQNVSDFAVRDGAVTATLLGYSSPDVPRCCPDEQHKAKWQWKDGAFDAARRRRAQRVSAAVDVWHAPTRPRHAVTPRRGRRPRPCPKPDVRGCSRPGTPWRSPPRR